MDSFYSFFKDTVFVRPGDVSKISSAQRLPSGGIGDISDIGFNTDEISMNVNIRKPQGALLFFADAYHPDWHAQVDGQSKDVLLANGVYKALYLDFGEHRVRLYFDQGLIALAGIFIAVFGAVMGAFFIYLMLYTLLMGKLIME
jgi:hypothetical protein